MSWALLDACYACSPGPSLGLGRAAAEHAAVPSLAQPTTSRPPRRLACHLCTLHMPHLSSDLARLPSSPAPLRSPRAPHPNHPSSKLSPRCAARVSPREACDLLAELCLVSCLLPLPPAPPTRPTAQPTCSRERRTTCCATWPPPTSPPSCPCSTPCSPAACRCGAAPPLAAAALAVLPLLPPRRSRCSTCRSCAPAALRGVQPCGQQPCTLLPACPPVRLCRAVQKVGPQFQAAADLLAAVMTTAADCVETGAPYADALGEPRAAQQLRALRCCPQAGRTAERSANARSRHVDAAPPCAAAAAALRKMEAQWRKLPKLCPELNSRRAAARGLCVAVASVCCCAAARCCCCCLLARPLRLISCRCMQHSPSCC